MTFEKIHLDRPHGLHLLREMMRIRAFEERCVALYRAEKIRGLLHLYDGEEAVAVGVMQALSPADAIVATYREHGQALARGIRMRPLMAELLGRAEGTCRGRGGSMHIFDRATRFYGGNSIGAGGLPIAVGVAMADKLQGSGAVTACFFGEGAVDEGEFHECMHLASLWAAPVLFVCENNLQPMGTPLAGAEADSDIWRKAACYRMTGEAVDGMDVVATAVAARHAVGRIRDGGGPQLLECRTWRFRANAMFDVQPYRSTEEVASWRDKDPITRLRRWLEQAGHLHADDLRTLEAAVADELEDAVAFAEAGTLEPVAELDRFVMMDKVPT
jgi:pyruvate dehydrogenase E1 component alpha subunit